MDATYAMAHALHRMVADVCGANKKKKGRRLKDVFPNKNSKYEDRDEEESEEEDTMPALCAELSPTPTGPELLKYIRNVSFTSK